MHKSFIVPKVDNKIYFRVTSKSTEADIEPLDFERAELIEYCEEGVRVLSNHISPLHDGISVFILNPEQDTKKCKYIL